ncbi:MAG TPA: hypothetical protein VEJ63_01835 [Planctomycetota bacterium]|nr:hypothetical protein [Planctomycetota bacterium]
MDKITVDEAAKSFEKIVEYVVGHEEAVTVSGPSGDLVRIIPVPKPVGEWKGRPVYKLKDVQHLDYPYW